MGLLALGVGTYGSHRVFHFAEDYLTARSAAEALAVTALAVHIRGAPPAALAIAAAALFIHPLMALPALLSLIFLNLPDRVSVGLAAAGVATVLVTTLAANASALHAVLGRHPALALLDPAWLAVVRERSQFLFVPLWSLTDAAINARPFASLALSAALFTDARVRKLCFAAALVGVSGLLVSAIAGIAIPGAWQPVALFVQGQAWRWVWITAFVAALLVFPTALAVWRDRRCGPLCALWLLGGWTLGGHAPWLATAALVLFLLRTRLPGVMLGMPRSTAMLTLTLVSGLGMLAWAGTELAALPAVRQASVAAPLHRVPLLLQDAGFSAAIRLPLALLLVMAWQSLRKSSTVWLPAAASAVLIGAAALLAPVQLRNPDSVGTASEVAQFAPWRDAIPPTASVYLADGRDAASFAWFTLGRPSYLSLDQSAGVIFSRATALEVARRSAVLLPLTNEDWKLLSKNRAARGGVKSSRWTPLTAASLMQLCGDPQLGFLIARENVGFEPLVHERAGLWQNWNLYDCRRVRGGA